MCHYVLAKARLRFTAYCLSAEGKLLKLYCVNVKTFQAL